MNRSALTRRLHLILLGTALCGLLFYTVLLPYFIWQCFPHDRFASWICLILLWLSAVPCYRVLFLGRRIVRNIACDRSFTEENAHLLRKISSLAAADALYIFLANPLLILLNIYETVFLPISIITVFVGIAISVAAAALSHLVLKAAELQEQSDLTI
jgi:hypothetical protein